MAKAAGRAGKGSGEKGHCRYFANGNCRKGANCNFSHEIGGGSKKKGASSNKNRQLGKQDVKSEEVAGKNDTSKNRQCLTCDKVSARLTKLQSQTKSGQEFLGKIASALVELQAQVELAQANLEQTTLDVSDAIKEFCNGDAMPSDQPPSSSVKKNKAVKDKAPTQTASKLKSNAPQSRTPQRPETSAPSGSVVGESEIINTKKRTYDERASPTSSDATTINEGCNEGGNDDKKGLDNDAIPTPSDTALEGIVTACARYISGSPKDYITSLRRGLNVETLTLVDLVEVMEECLEVLTSMKDGSTSEEDAQLYKAVLGGVATGMQESFCNALLSEAKKDAGAVKTGPAAAHSQSLDTVQFQATASARSASDGGRQQVKEKKQCDGAGDGGWTCPKCTCVNPKLFLLCSGCGSTGGDATAEEMLHGSLTPTTEPKRQSRAATLEPAVITPSHGAEKKDGISPPTSTPVSTSKVPRFSVATPGFAVVSLPSSTARKKRATPPTSTGADTSNTVVGLQPDTKTSTAQSKESKQAEEKKREDDNANQQQKEAMQKREEELAARQQREKDRAAAEAIREKQAAMARREANMLRQEKVKRVLLAIADELSSKESTARKTKTVVVDRLSFYIKPSRKKGKKNTEVSPIFDLIQEKGTIEDGRKLMVLEVETQRCKDKIAEMVDQRAGLLQGLKKEEQTIKECKLMIEKQDRVIDHNYDIEDLSSYNEVDMQNLLAEM